jgi:FtsP/CotA-like multicopper oxidase with cupredoxin domain
MRLNVYAGLASFYIVRDQLDTGKADNPLGLPAEAYELAYVIQDHIFYSNGEMHYPAYPDDPFYQDFIESELPSDQFPNGGPTALAEFFGDIMLVNGVIWPKVDVEPREYRLRLLNGCDSRYLVIDFRLVESGAASVESGVALEYTIIGSDSGLGNPSVRRSPFVLEPGARYDIVLDMSQAMGKRIIMHNLGGDAPFGGAYGDSLTEEDVYEDRRTDRIMAFDVVEGYPVDMKLDLSLIPAFNGIPADNAIPRQVALFEGLDEFGRLQPVLGTKAMDSSDPNGLYPAYTWSGPTTEKPRLGTIEEWYILNFSAGRCRDSVTSRSKNRYISESLNENAFF